MTVLQTFSTTLTDYFKYIKDDLYPGLCREFYNELRAKYDTTKILQETIQECSEDVLGQLLDFETTFHKLETFAEANDKHNKHQDKIGTDVLKTLKEILKTLKDSSKVSSEISNGVESLGKAVGTAALGKSLADLLKDNGKSASSDLGKLGDILRKGLGVGSRTSLMHDILEYLKKTLPEIKAEIKLSANDALAIGAKNHNDFSVLIQSNSDFLTLWKKEIGDISKNISSINTNCFMLQNISNFLFFIRNSMINVELCKKLCQDIKSNTSKNYFTEQAFQKTEILTNQLGLELKYVSKIVLICEQILKKVAGNTSSSELFLDIFPSSEAFPEDNSSCDCKIDHGPENAF